jgi:hypothetical protein
MKGQREYKIYHIWKWLAFGSKSVEDMLSNLRTTLKWNRTVYTHTHTHTVACTCCAIFLQWWKVQGSSVGAVRDSWTWLCSYRVVGMILTPVSLCSVNTWTGVRIRCNQNQTTKLEPNLSYFSTGYIKMHSSQHSYKIYIPRVECFTLFMLMKNLTEFMNLYWTYILVNILTYIRA